MLILIRHATTELNRAGILQGTTSSPLAPDGVREAQRLASWLARFRPTVLISSDSPRAATTASIIGDSLNIKPVTHTDLGEREYGPYAGMSITDVARVRSALGHSFSDPTQDWHGNDEVESDQSIVARVGGRIESLYPPGSNHTALVVTHAGVIKAFLHSCLGVASAQPNIAKVPPASAAILDYNRGDKWRLIALIPNSLILVA